MLFWLVVVVLFIAVAAGIYRHHQEVRRHSITQALTSPRGFSPTQSLVAADGLTGMAVDERRRKVCLAERVGEQVFAWTYNYGDILDVQISEDDTAITQRHGTFGRAVVGGLIFGEAGAIVGGLSGTTSTKTQVQGIDLRLIIRDTSRPSHSMRLLTAPGTGVAKASPVYQDALRLALHWHALLKILAVEHASTGRSALPGPAQAPALDNHQMVCCPFCDREYRLQVPAGGKSYRCASCREVFQVTTAGVIKVSGRD